MYTALVAMVLSSRATMVLYIKRREATQQKTTNIVQNVQRNFAHRRAPTPSQCQPASSRSRGCRLALCDSVAFYIWLTAALTTVYNIVFPARDDYTRDELLLRRHCNDVLLFRKMLCSGNCFEPQQQLLLLLLLRF